MKFPTSYISTFRIIIPIIALSFTSPTKAQSLQDSISNDTARSTIHFRAEQLRVKDNSSSSESFFNLKNSSVERYTEEKLEQHASTETLADSFKNTEQFWYVKTIEKLKTNESRLRTDPAYKDSLLKEGILLNDKQIIPQKIGAFTYRPWLRIVI